MRIKHNSQLKQIILIMGAACLMGDSVAGNDNLIELARKGNYTPAIKALQAQVKANNADQTALSDLVTILGWAEQWTEAVLAGAQLDPKNAPVYGIKGYALAAKRLGKLQTALEQYDTAIARSLPTMAYDLHAARLLVLCEMNKCLQGVDDTEKLFDDLARPEPANTHELMVALAKAYIALDRKTEALAVYQRILQVSPQNIEIAKEQTFLLSNMRASLLAKQLQLISAPKFTEEGLRSISQEAVSQQIRFGDTQMGLYWDKSRFSANEIAIQESFKLKLANALAGDSNSRLSRNSDWDRLIALRDGSKATTVIAEYQEMRGKALKSNVAFEPPGYVLATVADAHLYNKQPKQGIYLYKQALAQFKAGEEINNDWQLSLVYAYLDNNDYSEALTLTNKVLNQTAQIKNKNIAGLEAINPQYTQWRVMEILVYLYSDMLPKANELINKFREIGPYNVEVRNAQASLSQAYGLNRLALDQYIATSVDNPNDLSSLTGLAGVLLANREFKLAREQIAELVPIFPNSGSVQRLAKDLLVHDSIEISTSINTTGPDLNRPDDLNLSNSKELKIATEIKSAAINEHFRIGGFVFDRGLKGLDRTIHDRTLGMAFYITKPDYLVSANLNSSSLLKPTVGTSISATWLASDYVQYNGRLEIASAETPLRALDIGVTANVAGLGVTYKADDSQVWSANAEVWKFSDDNTRRILSISQKQRLNYHPTLRVHSRVTAAYSSNTNTNVPYFSPQQDLLLEGELEIDHLMWRDYEYSARQHLWASVGNYAQYSYGNRTNWSLRYAHEWRSDPWWSLRYGIGLNQRHFDGNREKHKFVFANGTRYF